MYRFPACQVNRMTTSPTLSFRLLIVTCAGIALIAAAIALSRRNKVSATHAADENSDYVDQNVVPSTATAAGSPYKVN